MLLQLFTIIALVGGLQCKPSVVRTISDCSITDDGILHYQGKHSFTRFEHECLPWSNLQTVYSEIVNEPNFFNDVSIKAAKNYCRNPNMNVNGPWCFVQNEDEVSMEECDVCQSLASRPTASTDIDSVDDTPADRSLFQRVQDELRRYGLYVRDKFVQIVEHMKQKFSQVRSKISNHFNGSR